jgi:hypothetical protein
MVAPCIDVRAFPLLNRVVFKLCLQRQGEGVMFAANLLGKLGA